MGDERSLLRAAEEVRRVDPRADRLAVLDSSRVRPGGRAGNNLRNHNQASCQYRQYDEGPKPARCQIEHAPNSPRPQRTKTITKALDERRKRSRLRRSGRAFNNQRKGN